MRSGNAGPINYHFGEDINPSLRDVPGVNRFLFQGPEGCAVGPQNFNSNPLWNASLVVYGEKSNVQNAKCMHPF